MNTTTYDPIDEELSKVPIPISVEEKLDLLLAEHGSPQALAEATGLEETFILALLEGFGRPLCDDTCARLGLRKVVYYFEVPPKRPIKKSS